MEERQMCYMTLASQVFKDSVNHLTGNLLAINAAPLTFLRKQ